MGLMERYVGAGIKERSVGADAGIKERSVWG